MGNKRAVKRMWDIFLETQTIETGTAKQGWKEIQTAKQIIGDKES